MTYRIAAALLAALSLGACVAGPPPAGTPVVRLSVEDQKKDIALQRDRGLIGFEEAARRQYAIQRNAYRLSPGETAFWETSIGYAREVDSGRMSPAEYKVRVQQAYGSLVGGTG